MLRDLVVKNRVAQGAVALALSMALSMTVACTKQNLHAPSNDAASASKSASKSASNNEPTVISVKTREVASPGDAALRMATAKRIHLARATKSADQTFRPAFASAVSPIVASEVTFDKSAIFNRVFLYGSDLQYSSIGEDDGMLLQSLSIGHVTARFQVIGDRLQLVAEEKYRFESNINIPLSMLHEWKILNQTVDRITVDVVAASPTLGTVLDADAKVRTSWVRSVEFVPQGNYLLIESSIELADGKVAEFMESVFPRETLVSSAPAPIFDDASIEPLANRFGFLSNTVWATTPDGRVKTAVAQRFNPPAPGQTIDWYVTPNIPAEYIPAVQGGIEGWNRYSQKMWGRDFVKFKGLLPAGVKIGDPRYNVVNWDSVVDASAAYESQASDPETGIQSHSLIYLPYAWVKIGREFWEHAQLTQDRTATLKAALDQAKFLAKKVEVRCFNEAELGALDPKMKTDPETFSKELLRGTLFHEVGHALGLAHNFKGSLSWDPDVEDSVFTTSIMDYNHYGVEIGAFDDPTVNTGPLLEYDRQILSALYNDAKDIAATDVLVPHCDDSVADSKTGGVDPFCIRYDAGHDPSLFLGRTLQLIQDPTSKLGKTNSLATTAEGSLSTLGDPAELKSELEVHTAVLMFRTQLSALIQYYVSAGAQGLSYMMSANLRNLAVFKSGSVPDGLDPIALRERVAETMDQIMTLEQFSPATRTAFEKIGIKAAGWLLQTNWYGSAATAERSKSEKSIRSAALDTLNANEKSILPRLRVRQLQALARSSKAPFFLTTSVDYEAKALAWLELVLVKTLPSGADYTVNERIAAAQTLASFKAIPQAEVIKTTARAKVDSEIARATSAEEREALRALAALL